MAILNSCCCWNNVRSGSLAAGIYTLVLALINGGLVCYNLVQLHDLKELDEGNAFLQPMESWFLCVLITCVLLIIASVILIVGIHRDNRFCFIPWLIMTVATITIDTVVLIIQCVHFGVLTFNIIQMVIWLAITLLNVYAVMCVISQFQELRNGRGTVEYLRQSRAMVMYRPGIQQVHITQGPIVMAAAGQLTASTRVRNDPEGQPSVTTSVVVSPPDYNVATSQLPVYTSAGNREKKASRSPPPPYQP